MQNGAYVGLSPKSYFAFEKKDGKVEDKKGAKGTNFWLILDWY